jgi:hypothetical protein
MSSTTTGLFDDCLELEAFARQVKRHPRTVKRWMLEPDGLPYTWLGNRTIVHVPTARAWMLGRLRRPNPRRPRKVERTTAAATS